jgi:hypothetical protein
VKAARRDTLDIQSVQQLLDRSGFTQVERKVPPQSPARSDGACRIIAAPSVVQAQTCVDRPARQWFLSSSGTSISKSEIVARELRYNMPTFRGHHHLFALSPKYLRFRCCQKGSNWQSFTLPAVDLSRHLWGKLSPCRSRTSCLSDCHIERLPHSRHRHKSWRPTCLSAAIPEFRTLPHQSLSWFAGIPLSRRGTPPDTRTRVA